MRADKGYRITSASQNRPRHERNGGRDRCPFTASPIATNHRGEIPDSIEHAERYASVERRDCLAELIAANPAPEELVHAFLQPPLHSTHYWRAFGTVYTALYRPASGVVELHWPDRQWRRAFDDPDDTFDVVLNPS